MRAKRVKNLRRLAREHGIGESEAETKREIRKAKRNLIKAKSAGNRSKLVTKGLFCGRVGRESTKGEGDRA